MCQSKHSSRTTAPGKQCCHWCVSIWGCVQKCSECVFNRYRQKLGQIYRTCSIHIKVVKVVSHCLSIHLSIYLTWINRCRWRHSNLTTVSPAICIACFSRSQEWFPWLPIQNRHSHREAFFNVLFWMGDTKEAFPNQVSLRGYLCKPVGVPCKID